MNKVIVSVVAVAALLGAYALFSPDLPGSASGLVIAGASEQGEQPTGLSQEASEPSPTPEPTAEPAAEPTHAPTPEPTPSPTPAPTPEVTPLPEEYPSEVLDAIEAAVGKKLG